MKAWRIEAHGGLDALVEKDIPAPVPGPMEARVRVEAVGLNHLDIWVRKGVAGHKFPLPLTPGCDVAGVIESCGPGAAEALATGSGLAVGSPVIVSPGVSCGRCQACLDGMDPLCPAYGILGETRDGGCAEHVVVPAANLIARPAGLSAAEAAALPIPYLTAWSMLFRKAELRPGEVVLIQAGGSGVSVAATQLAKMVGATVVTTVGSPEKARKSLALGADFAIDYRAAPFRGELKQILAKLGRKGCDVVIDHVGADTFEESLKALAWGGRLATCGATSGAEVKVDLKRVFFKNISIHGTTMGSKADLLRIVALAASGKLRPVIAEKLPMRELRRAHEILESRKSFGKVVVTA